MSKEDAKEGRLIRIKEDLINAFDENGNGQIDIEDVIIKCMKIPGIKVNREEFLRKEFGNKLSKEVIDKAILENPMKAKIKSEFIDEIADDVIKFEKLQVSGISAALSAPGGWAMLATIPADIVQYYGYLLKTMQKLLYLYGYPQLDFEYEGNLLDSESMGIVVTCLGIMFGVGTANKLLHKLSPALAEGLGKKFMRTAVTKQTVWYPALKKICRVFNYTLTKEAFRAAMKKAIPVIGFAVGGTITYFSFGPCCKKLQTQLKDTIFSNPNYVEPVYDDLEVEGDICIEVSEDEDCEIQ